MNYVDDIHILDLSGQGVVCQEIMIWINTIKHDQIR